MPSAEPQTSDVEALARHREIWAARPELREVYAGWFRRLLAEVAGFVPVVEVGSGPGFFKEFAPCLVATDLVPEQLLDVRCDAGVLPFGTGSVGALVMVDTLHHLPYPLRFLDEAARILQPGGRVAMLEPWITPASFVLYRYLHHESCRLAVDLARPFADERKAALDGNAAIPYLTIRQVRQGTTPMRLVRLEPFVGLSYLVTLGFKRARPMPGALVRLARAAEPAVHPLRRILATRVLLVLGRAVDG